MAGTQADQPVGRAVLERLFDRSPGGVQIVDRRGKTTYTNPAFRALFEQDAAAPTAASTAGDAAFPAVLAAALAAAQEGQPGEARAVALPATGHGFVLANVSLTPLADAAGETAAVVLQYEILSGLDQLLIDVAASKARLDAAISSAHEGIILLDPRGQLLLANLFAHDLFGIAQGRLLGLAGPDLAEMLRDAFTDTESLAAAFPFGREHDPEEERTIEYTLARPLPRTVRHTVGPIYDRDGSFLGRVLLLHDVTAEHAALRARDELLSVASHELRTPLTAIKGFAQLLERDLLALPTPIPARTGRHLDAVLRQVGRLTRLVNELLEVSRIEAGQLTLHRERCDLAALAAEVIERLEADPARPPHRLLLERPPGEIVGLWDPGQLDQVLTNLLDNALRYSPAHSTIRVTISPRAGEVEIAIADEGRGIPAGQLRTIFEPFTHVQTDEQQPYTGFGLGLYIARRIVERHSGQIWAENAADQGSIFRVILPH